jgi:hypothetical protein
VDRAEAGGIVRRTVNHLAAAVTPLLLATPFTVDAQPPGRVHRIALILSAAPDEVEHLVKALDDGNGYDLLPGSCLFLIFTGQGGFAGRTLPWARTE